MALQIDSTEWRRCATLCCDSMELMANSSSLYSGNLLNRSCQYTISSVVSSEVWCLTSDRRPTTRIFHLDDESWPASGRAELRNSSQNATCDCCSSALTWRL